MNERWGSDFPYRNELNLPGMDKPLAYLMGFEWGTLRVSEAADEAYRLKVLQGIPIIDPRNYGASHRPEPLGPAVDIWLHAPGELADIPRTPKEFVQRGYHGYARQALHKSGVALSITLPRTEAVRDRTLSQLERAGALEDALTSDESVPLEDEVSHSMPDLMCQEFEDSIREAAMPQILEWMRMKTNHNFWREQRITGLSIVIGSLATPSAGMIANGRVSTAGALLTVGGVAGLTSLNMRDIRNFLRSSAEREAKHAEYAKVMCNRIASDIYETYSPTAFAERMNRLMPVEEDERDEG